MISRIKKEFNEWKEHKAHMSNDSKHLTTEKNHFEELVKLAARTNARFKITGGPSHFIIKTTSDSLPLAILMLILIFVPGTLLFRYHDLLLYWLAEAAIFIACFLFMRYHLSGHHLEINCHEKTIKISSNNWIKAKLTSPETIACRDFKRLTFTEKRSKSDGITTRFNMVSMHYNNTTKLLVDLPNGPFYYINHHVFIKCLTAIIKNNA